MARLMKGTSSTTLPFEAIMYLIHHIFLPPKLPNEDDFDSDCETALINTTLEALVKFKDVVTYDQNSIIDSVISMVTNLGTVRDSSSVDGSISEEELGAALRDLCNKGGIIPLHIRAQNAGVLISKVDDSIDIEVFELSPCNEAVITTKGRLRRSFPGPSFSVGIDTFQRPEFQAMVAHTLAKMSYQPVVETMPKAKKAGRMHVEDRDTVHPKIVTELFTSILKSVGNPVDVSRLWKNTREEVMWLDSRRPWRRSPLWLFIRVAMQLVISRSTTAASNLPGDLYKTFMVFFMGRVLELALPHSLHSDMFYALNAKLAQRLLKLDSSVHGPILDSVESVMQDANRLIHERWSNIVKQSGPRYDPSRLKRLDFNRDVFNPLPKLDEYIKSLSKRKNDKNFVPFDPAPVLAKYQAEEFPTCVGSMNGEYKLYNLRALEAWIASDLPQWLQLHKSNSSTCCKLGDLIETYYAVASPVYSGNPETYSMMLLTILELWIACDESAVQICKLLLDYDPGIPQSLLQSLTLPFKCQMERLLRAEGYLKNRQERAIFPAPSIFRDFGLQNCFSVRYFNQSPAHQDLLRIIVVQETKARLEKCNELRLKKEEYGVLMKQHNESECEFHEVIVDHHSGFSKKQHSNSCKRCHYKARATSMRIQIHEWSLPSNILKSRSTVFELQVPRFFGRWRDTTVFLLFDVLKVEYSSTDRPRANYPLYNYRGLSSFFTPFSSEQRIGLLSEDKPHEVTHRRQQLVYVATESDVCLNNGLHYQYHDSSIGLFVSDFRVTDEIPRLSTYTLPAQSASLQKFLYRPATMPNGLSPNTVIASQSDCPVHMSLDEYKALCTIPLGCRIQWQNILLQLSAPSVDFKKVETGLVILQSIYQTGPSSNENVRRAGHQILEDENFAHSLLANLQKASQRVKENWESSQALSTFISLATRLLSLTSVGQIREGCLAYLASARAVALDWVKLLKDKAHRATDDGHKAALTSKLVEIALICVGSFDVDERYLDDVLSLPNDASDFIQCSVVIQEGSRTIPMASNPMILLLHQRWRWLSYRGYPILAKQIIEARSRSLDDSIKQSWSAYQAGVGWQRVSEKFDHWLVSRTAPQYNSDPLLVHFNLLTGELLVNGLPLSRLPSRYESHLTYRILFGHSALEVMPTTVRGMHFSGKKEYAGYTLHLGLNHLPDTQSSPEYDLLIQAVKDDRKCELIPSRLLDGMFPEYFVKKFVQWYDMADDYLEFRPIEDPWTSSPDNWRLTRDGLRWHLMKHGASLISVNSDTAAVLSRMLSPVEVLPRIHIIFHRSKLSLEVDLPRLQLGFHLKSGDSLLQSTQFRGMAVDSDQSLGTLVGLQNKLVLKHKDGGRLVILPEGPVSCVKHDDHVNVIINKASAAKTHLYSVDGQIGRLVDNGSLQSKLFLCYLHALTSFCLPDPLICRTGTEQALSILSSAAVRSFDRLTRENIETLEQIAHLTPGRSYYPANERVMQKVKWSPAPNFMAQHSGLYKCVASIFEQADRTKVFYPQSYIQPPDLKGIDSHLLERDCIRSSTFRVSGFGAEDHTVKHDALYISRDQDYSVSGRRAFIISSIIYHGRTALQYDVPSNLSSNIWDFLSQAPQVLGPNHSLPPSKLAYDAEFLLNSSGFLAKYWTPLHRMFSEIFPPVDRFRLMIWLSTLAFASNADMNIVQTLASFLTVPEMVQISAPLIPLFDLSQGVKVSEVQLRDVVRSACLPIHRCPEATLPRNSEESKKAFKNRQFCQFQRNQARALNEISKALGSQWPCENPTTPIDDGPFTFRQYVDMAKVMEGVKWMFKAWYDNYRFNIYLCQIGNTLSRQVVDPLKIPSSSFAIPTWNPQRRRGYICIDDIFSCPAPSLPPHHKLNLTDLLTSSTGAENVLPRLEVLVRRLEAQSRSNYQNNYVEDLRGSVLSLQDFEKSYYLLRKGDDLKDIFLHHLRHCEDHVYETYQTIISTVASVNEAGKSTSTHSHNSSAVAHSIKQWPRLSPTFFLQQLSRGRWQKIKNDWKGCIVHYGLALIELQRAERLLGLSSNHIDLIKELLNPGHTNWNPIDYPESLLLEVESGIIIRDVQEQIAGQMRNPRSGANSVLQLNMGEGKSSVIVPIVAAAIADGSRLVRAIVAKPQSRQMFQMLVSKLGGLLDRRVYHMPFSRALELGEAEADAIGNLYRECMSNGGVLLVQPEHILSFKLMGLECLISGKESLGCSLLRTQGFFDTSSRDIVDESDENFNVKFELIYTMGMQRPVELSPERWICIHQVLNLVRLFAPGVAKDFPLSMEVHERWAGSFPRTRVLQNDAQRQLLDLVAERICETGLSGFPIARQSSNVRQAVFRYITEPDLTESEIAEVENQGSGGFWADTTSDTLLLLRGLVAGGVLPFAFGQKRWRVNYGLDATRQPRTKLAVPYRAKDNPTSRSEFSHPDVVIVLTSLSYYYGGLDNDDLFVTFSHIMKSDQAEIEYEAWVRDAPGLPPAFRQLVGINLKDHFQCTEHVFPPLRYAKSVVDYFLSHIVFPKEMKEFPHKLSASGWDIGQTKTHPTTGFSGTNDSRKTLPLSVEQLDLEEQKHTNALVLEYLLRSENSVMLMPPRKEASSSDAEVLLAMVAKMEPPAQVIVDVGAQILELTNLDVAKEWMKMLPDHGRTQAVVYFDDCDELSVLDRRGNIELLQTSSFAKQLDLCLVYLDEAHTRGTDLKLPEYYRAAVTLGANLTKDRLVQACMRMRKLGKGQSVVFCVPEEIKTKILARTLSPGNVLIVSDVLNWAISETWIDMQRNMPLWAAQGQRYEHQRTIWTEAHISGEIHMSNRQAERFLEDESQTLEARYRPIPSTNVASIRRVSESKNYDLIMERCREFGSLELNSARLQEEQERELSPEIEQERQIQRPPPAQAATHTIHHDLKRFVSTGMLVNRSKAYMPAFETLRNTSAAAHFDVTQFPDGLLVTVDFASTIQTRDRAFISDSYQRPVQWILTGTGGSSSSNNTVEHIMIISPYEAEGLLPEIKKSKTVTLHLYAPRLNPAFRAMDGLDLYTVPELPETWNLPRRLALQLGLFSGLLFLGSFSEYTSMCELLGLAWEKAGDGCVVAADGFVVQNGSGQGACRSSFSDSPVKFLKVFMTKIRRNCEGISKTHMGTILDGSLLRRSDFEEPGDGV
ncbi:hypothetical protein EMCG_07247 [[Emmonsia] crescens]|uniref:ubiquitinyl hydrolase 1 n=1 Tax=[Emmonsia] crescens TaxID=73230 RepID=A0A0G2JB92_9EURO|nr:hypothetical protein EMCG_07247 [Emmonsia crescens UAMH 3008]